MINISILLKFLKSIFKFLTELSNCYAWCPQSPGFGSGLSPNSFNVPPLSAAAVLNGP